MHFIQNMYEYMKVFGETEKLSKSVHLKCNIYIYIYIQGDQKKSW